MKNILILVPGLGIGGQEKIAINTSMCLKHKYNVKIVIFWKSTVEYDYPCEVINLDLPAKDGIFGKTVNQIRRIFKMAYIRRQTKADLVISLGTSANLTNVFSSFFSRGKCISSIHGFAEVKKSILMDCILRFSDKVICIAKAMREGLLSLYPKAKNVCVIENGYDVETIIHQSREMVPVPFSSPAIISMGRLEHVKGFDRLIKAFAIVKREHKNLQLVLLGKGSLHDELLDIAKKECVEDSVRFLGYQVNPYAFLRNAQLYVLSSRNEGFPNCLIEALCSELPIVSMDCLSGPREILSEEYTSTRTVGVQEEKYGVLVEESVSEEQIIANLSQAIIHTLNDRELMHSLRVRAIIHARQFGNEAYKEKIISLIEEVLAN